MLSRQAMFLFTVLVSLLLASNLNAAPWRAPAGPEPTIVVVASYPGANAQVVAETVAAPIEHEVHGVENLLRMVSRSTADGRYVLALTFEPGTDLSAARVLVQNRIAVVQPRLPMEVMRAGVTIKQQAPVLMLVNLSSPTGRYDALYLSNYATIHITDELKRVRGVGDVMCFGQRDYSMRVWLDPDKLASRKLTTEDVLSALRRQNVQVAAGQVGQPSNPSGQRFQYTVTTLGRLETPEQFHDIVVKSGSAGQPVYLKDVARVELGSDVRENSASFNGKPSVVLGIYPTGGTDPKDVSRAVADKLAALRPRLPDGVQLDVVFDFTANLRAPNQPTTPEYLLLDIQLPDAASADRTREALARCTKLLREVPGVQDVLTLTENPFDAFRNQPCILVRLASAEHRKFNRLEMKWGIREKFEKVPDVALRVRDLSRAGGSTSYGYPIDLAVGGPDAGKVRELALKLGERMQKSKMLTDVWVNDRKCSQLVLDIDRTKAGALGVAEKDIFDTLQVYLGSMYVNDFNRFGRTWQLHVSADKAPKSIEDLKNLQVRNDQGKMVPLSNLIAVRSVEGPLTINRTDLMPAVEVSANPVTALSVEKARVLCEAEFEDARRELKLPAGYHLIWLR